MIKDRWNMKWTAMMSPEHLVEIQDWKKERLLDKNKYILKRSNNSY